MKNILNIDNLSVQVEDKKIIKNFNFSLAEGEIHAIMGPNGSGKSSLAYSLTGHPKYVITQGNITFLKKDIAALSPDKRAKLGLFLAFQYPYEISGATVFSVLKEAYTIKKGKLVTVTKFSEMLFKYMDILHIDKSFAYRDLNEGFSGGEKKKLEILQLLMLQPKLAILDEIDSGLDIDALKVVSCGVVHAKKENPQMAIILITHYQRILTHIRPDFVHVMHEGQIKKSGNALLVKTIDLHGYNEFIHG